MVVAVVVGVRGATGARAAHEQDASRVRRGHRGAADGVVAAVQKTKQFEFLT